MHCVVVPSTALWYHYLDAGIENLGRCALADHRIQTTFRIDPDLLKKFRHELLDSDMKMTPVIEKLIRQWLSGHKYEREQISFPSEPHSLPPTKGLHAEATRAQARDSAVRPATEGQPETSPRTYQPPVASANEPHNGAGSQSLNSKEAPASEQESETTPRATRPEATPVKTRHSETSSRAPDSAYSAATDRQPKSTPQTVQPPVTSDNEPQSELTREMAYLWDTFLDRVKSRVSINTFTTWFQPTRLNRAEGETLFIQIPSAVFRQVLTRTYGDIV